MRGMSEVPQSVIESPDEPHDHGFRALVDGAFAVLVGLLAVIQARINGELALVVGSGIEAAVVSFGSGLLLIVVIVLVVPSARAGTRRLAHAARVPPKVPIWTFLGGVGGATFVAAQGLVVPTTGVALFTIAIVAGLSGNSLVADKYGIGPGGRRPVTWPRVVAALVAVFGVGLAVSGELGGGQVAVGLLALAMFAGATVAVQQGLNGRVAVIAGTPLPAALVNFTVGFTALLLVGAVTEAFDGQAFTAPPAPWAQPVLWLGGPIGVAFVVVAAFAVRGLGVLVFSLLTIVGQLVGGVLVDLVAPVPGDTGLTWQTIVAVLLSMAATVLAFLGSRRPTGTMHR
ncbi:MAG: family transporter [Actinomycetota bacterium]|nr:family transporter [Actinomycetota bacterium]